jgi:hypothetical protein
MEMLTTDMHGKRFWRLWTWLDDKPLRIVSTRDVGYFDAMALLKPEECRGKAVRIAGDELKVEEAFRIFKETIGDRCLLCFALWVVASRHLSGSLCYVWLAWDRRVYCRCPGVERVSCAAGFSTKIAEE